jgi:propionyl-CoA carboxylase alpha chain
VRLPGSAPKDTYLRGDLVVAAAQTAGATPCTRATASSRRTPVSRRPSWDAGLVWVGPPPAAIEAMGSKLAAKALMADAGVPCLRGSTPPG